MDEFIPTELELIDVLCRVRETDWECAVTRSNDGWLNNGRDGYKEFIKGFKNLREINQEYMRTPAQWKACSFSFILDQIRSSPKEDQFLLLELINRYKETAQVRLLDVIWREWDSVGKHKRSLVAGTSEFLTAKIEYQRIKAKFNHIENDSLSGCDIIGIVDSGLWWNFLGNSKSQEMSAVDEKSLVWRVLVSQELINRIHDIAIDQQQAAAPAADQEPKTPGRKEKLSMDMFMREIFPDMKLRFPDSKHVDGKKAYCETVGKAYGVSEKTIRDKFDTCNNNRGETM